MRWTTKGAGGQEPGAGEDAAASRRYRVLLRIEIGGQTHEVGEAVELDLETAKEYSHALVAAEEVADGGNQ